MDSNEKNILGSKPRKGRNLPPLEKPVSGEKKNKKKGGESAPYLMMPKWVSVVLFFGIILIVVAMVVFSGSSDESSDELLGKGAASEFVETSETVVPPLLLSLGVVANQEGSVLPDSPLSDEVIETVVQLAETPILPLNYSGVSEDLMGVKEGLLGLESGLSGVSDEVLWIKKQLIESFNREGSESKRVADLEESVAYLVKEVKRLKWLARQKKVSSKKRVEQPKVKGFFVWQYRPGVEIEFKGVSERFYEGDLLDGMRIVKIDMELEQVVLSKKGKTIILKIRE